MVGYAGLALGVLFSAYHRWPAIAWKAVALIVILHVTLVWAYRYQWDWAQATRNGYVGMVIFHTALVLIASSALVKKQTAETLARIAFVILTFGALGAVFRYQVVSLYRVPVVVCALLGCWGLWTTYRPAQEPRTQ